MVRIVCISGPRHSGKTTLIQRIQQRTTVPLISFHDATPSLCHWWEIQKRIPINVCIVLDDPPPSIWNSSVLTEMFTLHRHYSTNIVYTCQSPNLVPVFFRHATHTTIVCPAARNDPLPFSTMFADSPPRHGNEALFGLRAQYERSDPIKSEMESVSDAVPGDLPVDAVCPITLQPISRGQYFTQCTQCKSVFDYTAIATWAEKSQSCPICRAIHLIWRCYR